MRKASSAPPLGDLQLAIMGFLWRTEGATLGEVRAAIEKGHPVALTTVATVLSRLKTSGLISDRRGPGARIYVPAVSQGEVRNAHIGKLIDRLFGGRAADLITHLVRESEIDSAEIDRLRKALKKRRR